ncbi:hypothetical protein [Bradyrhizobium sp.]|uniref:hypothetical protein n=1 Tax=Bradyrhizobium sp. TaxID=376 RepID=UPI003C75D9F9
MLHWRIALTALRLPLGCVRLGGRIRIARDKDEAAHEALKAAERALVVALEAQPRAELAASLNARKARIETLKTKLLPLLKEFEAEIIETHHNALLWSLTGGSKQVHESLPDHLDFLMGHLELPGGLDSFLHHLDTHAAGILDGSKPASLGANFLKDRRQLAKAG